MNCYTNCLHCDVCKCADGVEYKDCKDMKADCEHFKNKADYEEVKQGEWIRGGVWGDTGSVAYICSVCKETTYDGDLFEHCPHCGARMNGDSTE